MKYFAKDIVTGYDQSSGTVVKIYRVFLDKCKVYHVEKIIGDIDTVDASVCVIHETNRIRNSISNDINRIVGKSNDMFQNFDVEIYGILTWARKIRERANLPDDSDMVDRLVDHIVDVVNKEMTDFAKQMHDRIKDPVNIRHTINIYRYFNRDIDHTGIYHDIDMAYEIFRNCRGFFNQQVSEDNIFIGMMMENGYSYKEAREKQVEMFDKYGDIITKLSVRIHEIREAAMFFINGADPEDTNRFWSVVNSIESTRRIGAKELADEADNIIHELTGRHDSHIVRDVFNLYTLTVRDKMYRMIREEADK